MDPFEEKIYFLNEKLNSPKSAIKPLELDPFSRRITNL